MFPLVIFLGLGYFVVRAVTADDEPEAVNRPKPATPAAPPPAMPPGAQNPTLPAEVVAALASETNPAKLEALAKKYDAVNPTASMLLRQRAATLGAAGGFPTIPGMPGVPGVPGVPGMANSAYIPTNAAGVPEEVVYALMYNNNPVELEALAKKYDSIDPRASATLRQKLLALNGGFPGQLNQGMLPTGTPQEVLNALYYEMDPNALEALAQKYDAVDPASSAELRDKAAILRGQFMEMQPVPQFAAQLPKVQGYGDLGNRPSWLPRHLSWPPETYNPSYPWMY